MTDESRKPEVNDNSFPYRVGFGLCNNDFTITEMSLAAFKSLEDAKAYVTFKNDNFVLHEKIYYIDEQDTQSMQTVRYIYDANKNEFISGNELVSSKRDIYIAGYEVSAAYVDEQDDFYYRKGNICLSYQSAELNKQEFLKDGATTVEIIDRDDIGIKRYFWGADKFLLGDAGIEQDEYASVQSEQEPTYEDTEVSSYELCMERWKETYDLIDSSLLQAAGFEQEDYYER